jgi:hypothetical protein
MTARMRSDELWPRRLNDHLDHIGDGIGASVTPARTGEPGAGQRTGRSWSGLCE